LEPFAEEKIIGIPFRGTKIEGTPLEFHLNLSAEGFSSGPNLGPQGCRVSDPH